MANDFKILPAVAIILAVGNWLCATYLLMTRLKSRATALPYAAAPFLAVVFDSVYHALATDATEYATMLGLIGRLILGTGALQLLACGLMVILVLVQSCGQDADPDIEMDSVVAR